MDYVATAYLLWIFIDGIKSFWNISLFLNSEIELKDSCLLFCGKVCRDIMMTVQYIDGQTKDVKTTVEYTADWLQNHALISVFFIPWDGGRVLR